jgi:elongator complex protein 1
MGNYHWYLKQEIPGAPGLSGVAWHPEKALCLGIVAPTGMTSLENIFYTARGSCLPPFDNGGVAVIDGTTVKLTPFRTANVPPPMALFEVPVDSSAVDVAFGRQNQSFAVLHRKGVDVFDWPVNNGRWTKPQLKCKVCFGSEHASGVALRITCTANFEFSCMMFSGDSGHQQLAVQANLETPQLTLLGEATRIVATSTFEDESSIESYGQDAHGRLCRLSLSGNISLPVSFQSPLPAFEVAKVDEIEIPIGLSRNGNLYAGTRSLAKNCTSFILTPSHLIFTTSNHLVKFVHLSSSVDGKLQLL